MMLRPEFWGVGVVCLSIKSGDRNNKPSGKCAGSFQRSTKHPIFVDQSTWLENITQEMRLLKPVRSYAYYVLMWISSSKGQSNPGRTVSESRDSVLSKVYILTISTCCSYVLGHCSSDFFCSCIPKWILKTSTSRKYLNWHKTFNFKCRQL